MSWSRKIGWSLVVAGALLAGVCVVPTVYGEVMSRWAIREFYAAGTGHAQWNRARVKAYQATLSLHFAPPVAVLRVPKVGLVVPVFEGTSDLILNRGVGHIAGTSMPGEAGNLAIAGHRDGFFRVLKDLAPNDVIEVQRPRAAGAEAGQERVKTDRYVVRSTQVVFPDDVSVLKPTRDATLTLVTCYPFYFVGSAPKRYIVQASLLGASSSGSAL